ncbi:universal stress protein [Salinivirga cyanobacteriivorans]|uniref:Universal stress protein UspG n=1 Tax=Salinivirga cyanobacteriivorans TaxID=1307839 RepID=A0A0S2I1D3_9BACT|nr:universal stress protein [Salinivirga cyanobacteriivorans]ALO15957.1 universal stress protein UspG [Salinivirga cyanobacteriivorans]
MERKSILVTWDFTEVSEYALQHAIRIAKIVDNDITLIHIVKNEKESAGATKKLDEVAFTTDIKYGVKPSTIVKEGSIFHTISEVASEIEANMVIMGTHGMRGMQKLTGSWALKVIAGSFVPFVVVQSPPSESPFNKIVVPINFKNENKEQIPWVIYLARYYRSKILFFKDSISDNHLSMRTNRNLMFAKKMLNQYNINYEILENRSKEKFADATITFAKENQADLIVVMTTKNIGFKDYMMGANEQYIIANSAKIPVMCINPREDLRKYGGFDRV